MPIPELYYSGLADRPGRQIDSRTPRAEDRVDEHCGVEGYATAAQAVVTDFAVLFDGCGVAGLARMYCTTGAQRNHEKKELDPLSR